MAVPCEIPKSQFWIALFTMLNALNSKENLNENLGLTGRCRTLKVQSHHQRFSLLLLCDMTIYADGIRLGVG